MPPRFDYLIDAAPYLQTPLLRGIERVQAHSRRGVVSVRKHPVLTLHKYAQWRSRAVQILH
jgi:hypothetical protein